MDNPFYLIQFIRGENDSAERNAPANRSCPRARHRHRHTTLVRLGEHTRDILNRLWKHEPVRVSFTNKTRVSQVRLDLFGRASYLHNKSEYLQFAVSQHLDAVAQLRRAFKLKALRRATHLQFQARNRRFDIYR